MGQSDLAQMADLADGILDGFERWVRRSLMAHALVTPIISAVYFAPTFSTTLLFLGFPWAITAPLFMLLLAIMLRGRGKKGAAAA